MRQVRSATTRLRCRPLCRLADDLGVDGPCDRRDQPPRPAAEQTKTDAGRDAGRLRGHLHLRHGRLGHHHCAGRSVLARHRSRRGAASATRRSAAARRPQAGAGTAWHQFELRAYRVKQDGPAVGKTATQAEALLPERACLCRSASAATADHRGGPRHRDPGWRHRRRGWPARGAGQRRSAPAAEEVDDRELLAVPAEGVDVYVTSKDVDGKTLAELATSADGARRLPAQDHARRDRDRNPDPAGHQAEPRRHRHPGWSHAGHREGDQGDWASPTGRPTSPTSPSSAGPIAIGALVGAFVYKVGGVPLTLSTAGGALILRPVLRLAALGTADLRTHSVSRPCGS